MKRIYNHTINLSWINVFGILHFQWKTIRERERYLYNSCELNNYSWVLDIFWWLLQGGGLIIILFNFGCRIVFLFFNAARAISCMAMSKSLNMIFERPLVLEIRTTNAVPKLSTILLMGSPITPHGESFAAFSTHEGLDSMLSLVMGLKSTEIFEGFWSGVIDVVPAARCATIAGKFEHSCWLSPP